MIILKTIFAFFFLMLLTRILGKKQMSEMSYFNYITGITLGTLTANIISTNSQTNLDEIGGLLIWGVLVLITAFITLKSPKARGIIDGEPTILIKNGEIIRESLQSSRLTLDDLIMAIRNSSIFSIKDVDYAILETNGRISILKKQEKLNLTKEDMNIKTTKPKYLPSQIISDGIIIDSILKEFELDEEWVKGELKKLNVKNVEEVFYAEIQADGKIYINKR